MYKIPKWQVKKFLKKEVTLNKYSIEATDEYGQAQKTLVGSYSIKAEIQPITFDQLIHYPPGEVEIGDAWGYFQTSYLVKGVTVSLEPDDEIVWNGQTFIVRNIEKYIAGEDEIYLRVYLKRIEG
ncbi:MAG: hypothetical protein DRP15_00930 [Candidatus Aenigmatarchaeota archaeon]|nr:MAG: hypothetical protein DRP15_00930 [Candidatus Aenigmarchaeota archaeon]